jgi:2-alkenal reductase
VAPAANSPVLSGSLSALQSTFESIYQQVSPSVVTIEVVEGATASTPSTSGRNNSSPFGSNPNSGNSATATALGSGFIWDNQGDIVTNNHVVSGATQITVTFLDGTTATAKVVGTDPNSDLAVIKVNVPASDLVPVTLADSTQVKVGDMAIAIGNPFGEGWTMTQGIISGLARSLPTNLDSTTATSGATYSIPDIIQTDAPINPGNSGGVLLNLEGQVIGVTSAIESNSGSSSGIGFVIPAEIVSKVVPSLISTGTYNHPYLGISGTTLTTDLATQMGLPASTKGALVEDVTSGGPASAAGLLGSTQQATINGQAVQVGGDVITAINGQPVQSMDDLSSYLFLNTTAGQSVTLSILRGGNLMTVKVTTGIMPAQ